MTHTPGPWIAGHMIKPDHPCNCRYILAEGYTGSIATVSNRSADEDSPPEDEAIANAVLIAAAPELVHALDELVMAVDLPGDRNEVENAMSKAKAALAKARKTTPAKPDAPPQGQMSGLHSTSL